MLSESESSQSGLEIHSDLEIETPSCSKTCPINNKQELLKGYSLVADLMRRQDEVIAEIDSLNNRIELAIQELSDARKLEQAALENQSEPFMAI